MSDEIKEFSLPQKGQIAASMQWNPPSFPQVGAETVVKIWFMGTVPYPGTTDTNLARINATFSAVPSGMRNQLVALAFQPFQNQANIKIELANTEAEANVRIGMFSDNDSISHGGLTVPNGELRDVYINLSAGQITPNISLGSEDVQTFMHEFGHALGLNHPSVNEPTP